MQRSVIIRLVILTVMVSCTMTTALNVVPANAQSPCEWTEYSSNPVFGQWLGNPNRAYYPKVIYDPNQFSGHGDNAYYKMWFGSNNGIGYAYSNDGINWTAGLNPLPGLVPGAHHPVVEYDPGGFGHGVYYKIWYWNSQWNYTIGDLRYAESSDGINWVNEQPFTQDATFKVVTSIPSEWNRGSTGASEIIYNPGGSNSLDDLNLWNNKYVMYYTATPGAGEFIGLGYSDNRTHWKRYGNNPVLSPCHPSDPSAGWDYQSVGCPTVMNIAGTWHMWYGGGPFTNHGIGYATSTNGIDWTKHTDNPIFHKDDGIPWRNDRTYTPSILYAAANFGGHGDAYPYKMWFSGRAALAATTPSAMPPTC